MYNCSLCKTFCSADYRQLLSHLALVHRNDPSFIVTCGYNGCSETKKSYSGLYSHVYRKHPELVRKRGQSSLGEENSDNAEMDVVDNGFMDTPAISNPVYERLTGIDVETQRRSSALFLLKLKEKRRLTQTTIDDIVESSRVLFAQSIEHIQSGLEQKLAEEGVEVQGLETVFKSMIDPFDGLTTRYQQERYFVEKLGLIEPVEVKIGSPYYSQRFTGHKREAVQVQDTFQYVSLLSSLKRMLAERNIVEMVIHTKDRIKFNGYLEDYCDGLIFQNHEVFQNHPCALQIVAYYDELELCNALGSYVKKHKVGVMFFVLGNLPPKHRSRLQAINLVSIATATVVQKHGIDEILRPFVNDLNVLSNSGIDVMVNGVNHNFKGALLAFLGDTLALHEVGGFKMSVSRALRICRTCMATSEKASTCFRSHHFELRTDSNHRQQCSLLNGPLREHYSTAYGITRPSILLDVAAYSMFNGGLPHDIMHDLFEGVVQYELKLLIKHLVLKQAINLEHLNQLLLNFDYGYSEVANKPTPITHRNLQTNDKHLRQNASQCALLCRILPLLVGEYIEEEDSHWECYLLLLKIVRICLSPVVSKDLCAVLQVIVEEHHTLFKAVYPNETITPKMHYMCHYPELMLNLGPLVRSWTMRYEAKLHFFKQAAHIGNFKNIALTLAYRQQRWSCYENASSGIVASEPEFGPGPSPDVLMSESESRKTSIITLFPDISMETSVFKPRWMKTYGTTLKVKDCFVVTGSSNDEPTFGRIDEIYVLGAATVLLIISPCSALFDSHYQGYFIELFPNQIVLQYSSITDYSVYHCHRIRNNTLCIVPKYMHIVQ